LSLRQLFDEEIFGDTGGVVLGAKSKQESVVFGLGFAVEDDVTSRKTVLAGILRDGEFTLRGDGTGGVLSVGAVGAMLGRGSHNEFPPDGFGW
jgi:hypothetical protein